MYKFYSMKKRSIFLIILGVIIRIAGVLTFNNLTTINAVDSQCKRV